mgnify:CR=1 FL=1
MNGKSTNRHLTAALKLAQEGPLRQAAAGRGGVLQHLDLLQHGAIAVAALDADPEVRVIVLAGKGKAFCAGIDLQMMMGIGPQIANECDGRMRESLRRMILDMQDTLTSLERCRKPVLAAIQGYCLGGAIDLISACDMRYCSSDAQFSIKEIDMGMAADVGTLQRLPRIIGDGIMRELAFTGRMVDAEEALRIGLVNRVYDDQAALLDGVFAIAREIAAKSPIAVAGTKEMLSYMRDHRIDDGLEYIATWNAAMLQSEDLRVAVAAHMSKQKPTFAD